MRIGICQKAAIHGKPKTLFDRIQTEILNPGFRRLTYLGAKLSDSDPPPLPIGTEHDHKLILLAEEPTGHLYFH